MPQFEIQQYEIHTMTYQVEASNEAEAIVKLLDGAAEPVDDSLDYIEVAEDVGLPVDRHPELADQLRSMGVPVDENIVPSISSVVRLD